MNVAAIVILYNPVGMLSNIIEIASQVSTCILVDNSDVELSNSELLSVHNIKYIWLGGNKGIAEAQNTGLEAANSIECDFIIFFDQDSEVPYGVVHSLYSSYLYLEQAGYNVGLIGPRAFNKLNGYVYLRKDKLAQQRYKSIEARFTPTDYTLSSGSLSRKTVFSDVGVMNSGLFIDSVDHEFCWRLCSRGYELFIDENVHLPHMLGAKQITFLGIKINVPSPIRHYYVFRNWCLLFRMSYVPTSFKIRTVLLMAPKALFFSLFVPPRTKRLSYIVRGLWDGCMNKYGKLQ